MEIEGRISGNTKTESVARGSVWDNFSFDIITVH